MRIFQSWRYPANWNIFRLDDRLLLILMAAIVGSCSGLAAVALNRSLMAMFEWLHHLTPLLVGLCASGHRRSALFTFSGQNR